jgi:hypothetical protein
MQSLETTHQAVEEEEEVKERDFKKKKEKPKREHKIGVTSMCMNNAGNLIYAGCTDSVIRVYEIKEKA